MDPEEIFAGLAEPRMQRTRRLVLGEGGAEEGAHEDVGEFVDADAPIEAAPHAADPYEGESRERREVETGRLADGSPTPGALSDLWSTLSPFSGSNADPESAGMRGGARTRERVHQLWDQLTSGQEDYGGRSPVTPVVGRDRRGDAPVVGALDTLGVVARRPEDQRRIAQTREQAPEATALGQAAAMPAWLAAPNPASAGGRIAMGAGLGAAAGGLHEEAAGGDAADIALSAGGGAALGGAFGAAAEGAGAMLTPRRAADALSRSAQTTQRGADQARLEASGVWGGRAMRAADELPGGQPRLAEDLRRGGVGERGRGQAGFSPSPAPRGATIPRMHRAAEDSETMRRVAGSQMASLAQQMDEGGAAVGTIAVRQRLDRTLAELDRLPIGGRDAAERIRSLAADLSAEDLSFGDAWRQRQMLDDMIGGWERDPNLSSLTGQLQAIRDALHAEMTRAAQRAGLGQRWAEASRQYQVGAFMREYGRGGDRLSVGGGMGGAQAAGDVVSQAVTGGNAADLALAVPRQMLGRAISQETRMAFPGVRARVGEASAGLQRDAAAALYQLAQAQPAALGRYGPLILSAGSRGPAALATTVYVLSQKDAEARRIFEEAQGLEQE